MKAEGEGVEPPTAEAAPVFETGYRASGSPSTSGPGRSRTCNPPIKSRQLCRVELRSREGVAGRNRTCGASRFRRPLYRAELRPRVSGQGWTRTSSLLLVRQALYAIELLARETPGQGFEPRPPRSERGVLAVRRSRKETISCSCHSPTLRPWIAAAPSLPRVFVEAFWSPALAFAEKFAGKSSRNVTASFTAFPRARTFLSRAGPRFSPWFSSS